MDSNHGYLARLVAFFISLRPQGAFDLEGQFSRDRHLPLGAHQLASHLVDRAHLLVRQADIDGFQNALVYSV